MVNRLHMKDADVSAELPPSYSDDDSDGRPPANLQAGPSAPAAGGSKDAKGKGKDKGKEGRKKDDKARLGQVSIDPSIDYTRYSASGPGLESRAELTSAGLINIWVNLRQSIPPLPDGYAPSVRPFAVDPEARCPNLNIVIFLVGSRGDVQPYIALALELIKQGNRVRIATHGNFCDFVLEHNDRLKGLHATCGSPLEGKLEFFDIGGDPKELMAYMVKNPGLLPGFASLTNGDIKSKRKMTKVMLRGCYRACHEPDQMTRRPFAADVIVSNPPAFAHIHVAEALGLPLVVSFTMPWSPTQAFPHPLVNVQSSNAEPGLTNYISYALADTLMWQGLGDIINDFRSYTLALAPLSLRTGPLVLDRLKVPITYAWSPSILPKPLDWKENIDISGFYFLDSNGTFCPDPALQQFLDGGEPPVYFGFGSVVVDDPDALTQTILGAISETKIRALVSAGWTDLGELDLPDNVFLIKGDIPHDWLFAEGRVAAVCHHGGAGTTAIGLKNGRPTIIVPFFGDQKFWGEAIENAGAGPAPIPYRLLSIPSLVAAIYCALSSTARKAAARIADNIAADGGAAAGAASLIRHLPLQNMRCDLSGEVATWWDEKRCLKLSSQVAGVLVAEKKVDWKELTPYRSMEYDTSRTASDPFIGGAGAILALLTQTFGSTAQFFWKPHKAIVNMVYGIPKASFDVVGSIHEGFENVPYILGSRVRPRRRVESFSSGWNEGVKGLGYGLYDGISGLVTEPWEGAKTGGVGGALLGMGKSYINVAARPAAGALGLVVLPVAGAFRGARASFMGKGAPSVVLVAPRQALSIEAALDMPKHERKLLAGKWQALVNPGITRARREGRDKWIAEAMRKPSKASKRNKGKGRASVNNSVSSPTWSGAFSPRARSQSDQTVLSDSMLARSPTGTSDAQSAYYSDTSSILASGSSVHSAPTPSTPRSSSPSTSAATAARDSAGLSRARAYAQAYRHTAGARRAESAPGGAAVAGGSNSPYGWHGPGKAGSSGVGGAEPDRESVRSAAGVAASEFELAMAGTERWAAPSVRSGDSRARDA